MRKSCPLPASLLALVLLVPLAQANTGILDQSLEPNPGEVLLSTGLRNQTGLQSRAGQSFTVGVDGTLNCVEVLVRNVLPAANPLILEIQTLAAGVPSGTVLASASLPAASVASDQPTWVAFDLSGDALAVSTTEVYAVVLRSDFLEINDVQWYNWYGVLGGGATYAGGNAFTRSDEDPWGSHSWDYGFRTYVSAPVPVESTTWGGIKRQFRIR